MVLEKLLSWPLAKVVDRNRGQEHLSRTKSQLTSLTRRSLAPLYEAPLHVLVTMAVRELTSGL